MSDFQNNFRIHSDHIMPGTLAKIEDAIDRNVVNLSAMAYEISEALKVYGQTTDVATLDSLYCFGVQITNCFKNTPAMRDDFLEVFAVQSEHSVAPPMTIFVEGFRGKQFDAAYDATMQAMPS